MAIKRIEARNFKSFKKLGIELGELNVVVGANASGKSNFVSIFEFIRDIESEGLDNAISRQGSEYFSNIGVGSSRTVSVKLVSTPEIKFGFKISDDVFARNEQESYEFSIFVDSRKTGFNITKDKLTLKLVFNPWDIEKKKPEEKKVLGMGQFIIRSLNGKVSVKLEKPKGLKGKAPDIFPSFLKQEIPPKTLLISTPYFFIPPSAGRDFSDFAIYDFNPKHSKKAVPIAGKSDLENDGSNLSLVLKKIVEDKNKKRKFSNLIKDLLPFVDDLETEKFADKFLLFKLREKYFKDIYFPASFISDGTVNISALLVALFFEQKPLTIIEEPERNVHPYLISKVMDIMKDASKNKQIIVTTHSPEVVKHAGLENILLVSRDKDGFSNISKPSEKKEVKIFLKNQMGLDELYIQNLLGD